MCVPPQVALVAISAGSSYLQYQQQKQLQKDQMAQQVRQNEIARKNALQRYASEQLRIRQEVEKSQTKGFIASKKAQEKRAEFIVGAGEGGIAMSGSTNALMADYYRTEGNYKNALAKNLDINISQYERNLKAIQFGEESQLTYLSPPNPELLFATNALNVANTYYSLEATKEAKGLMTQKQKSKA